MISSGKTTAFLFVSYLDQQQKLSDPYARLSDKLVSVTASSGLGLLACELLVLLMQD